MKVLMMQFINTFRGFRTSCACELIQTLLSATTKKNRKKRSDQQDYAHAYLCGMVSTLDVMHQAINDIRQCRIELQDLCIATLI